MVHSRGSNLKICESGYRIFVRFTTPKGECTVASMPKSLKIEPDAAWGEPIGCPVYQRGLKPCPDCPMIESIEMLFNEILRRRTWRKRRRYRKEPIVRGR